MCEALLALLSLVDSDDEALLEDVVASCVLLFALDHDALVLNMVLQHSHVCADRCWPGEGIGGLGSRLQTAKANMRMCVKMVCSRGALESRHWRPCPGPRKNLDAEVRPPATVA